MQVVTRGLLFAQPAQIVLAHDVGVAALVSGVVVVAVFAAWASLCGEDGWACVCWAAGCRVVEMSCLVWIVVYLSKRNTWAPSGARADDMVCCGAGGSRRELWLPGAILLDFFIGCADWSTRYGTVRARLHNCVDVTRRFL